MSPEECTLYSGAAPGTEATFGAVAERYGVTEVNYTFRGHDDHRTRGLKVLSESDLMVGDVNLSYISKLMNRQFTDTTILRNVLRCIWHQVNSGQEVFVIGWIQSDGTVRGGTGWGAEFAKLCNKQLYVFDQDDAAWFYWADGQFSRCDTPPVITKLSFTGTGTRFIDKFGTEAIEALFERSFG